MSKHKKEQIEKSLPSKTVSIILMSLLALAAGIYIPTLFVGFVYDDFPHLVNNNTVVLAKDLTHILFPGWSETRPFFNLVNRLQYALFGMNPIAFHALNILIHLFNGFIFYKILRAISLFRNETENRNKYFVLLATALFLLHPLQSESVANINCRSGTLMTTFYFLAMWLYINYFTIQADHSEKKRKAYSYLFLSLLCGLISQFFKESAITLVATIKLLDYFLRYKIEGQEPGSFSLSTLIKNFRIPLLYIITVPIVPILLNTVKNPHQSNIGFHAMDPWLHFVTQWKVWGLFLFKFIMPIGLNLDYDVPLSESAFDTGPLVGLGLIVTISLLAWFKRTREPWYLAGWIYFIVTMSPTNSIVPNWDFIAERHIYLPLAGLAIIMSAFLVNHFTKKTFMAGLVVIIYFCCYTGYRSYIWSSDERLFIETIQKSPNKDRPYLALAHKYIREKRYQEAIEVYNNTLKYARPSLKTTQVHINMGQILRFLKQPEKALESYDKAIALGNYLIPAYIGKSATLLELGRADEAFTLLKKVETNQPDEPTMLITLAQYYLTKSQPEMAYQYYQKSCNSFNPDACAALKNFKMN